MMFSTSSPTYPASVSVVASAMVKGTSRMRASVCASSVLPEPVGPISRMFDFASSTSLCLVWWYAQLDALVADENGRAGDELAHLVLALAAERAMERFLGFAAADLVHLRTPTRYKSPQPQPGRPNQAPTRSRRSTTRRHERWRRPPPHQSWRKLLRILDRLGCFSFLSALASIWRMRSRVTENRWPTSSSVWSLL